MPSHQRHSTLIDENRKKPFLCIFEKNILFMLNDLFLGPAQNTRNQAVSANFEKPGVLDLV
jgi:hypothetical protein